MRPIIARGNSTQKNDSNHRRRWTWLAALALAAAPFGCAADPDVAPDADAGGEPVDEASDALSVSNGPHATWRVTSNYQDRTALIDRLTQLDAAEMSYQEFLKRFPRSSKAEQVKQARAEIAAAREEEKKASARELTKEREKQRRTPQVTGIRQDAYAKAHPMEVEPLKTAAERSAYLSQAGQSQTRQAAQR